MRRLLPLAALLAAPALPAPASADPVITYSCSPAPATCKGWYVQPVTIHWAITGVPTPGTCIDATVDFDTAASLQSCAVTADQVTDTKGVTLKVDMTPPIVTGAAASRPPDHNGWYRSPVQVTFSGNDALSGLLGCSSTTYNSPKAGAVNLLGRCQDKAGNVSDPTAFGLRYDATPPTLAHVRVVPADEAVRVRWRIPDATAVKVWRARGSGPRRRLLSGGRKGTLLDRHVRNGRRYTYTLLATDRAGNVATRTVTVVPGPRLLAPAARARVTRPPLLRWTRVRGADYYNVQLFRGRHKLLSAWPTGARLRLDRTWRFGGRRYRLRDGRAYTWFVWPGRGPRAASDYGSLIGSRTFTLRAP
jgi:hypothetical protein